MRKGQVIYRRKLFKRILITLTEKEVPNIASCFMSFIPYIRESAQKHSREPLQQIFKPSLRT